MGEVNKQKHRELGRQMAHWVTVCTLLLHKAGGHPVHITKEDIVALEKEFTTGPEVIVRPDGNGGLTVSVVSIQEAHRFVQLDAKARR